MCRMNVFELRDGLAAALAVQPGGHAWIDGLPGLAERARRHWSLELEPPFRPGGVASWTAPARTATGEQVVLKLGFPHVEALHEPQGLRAWSGRGAVRLIDAAELDGSLALGSLPTACNSGCSPAV